MPPSVATTQTYHAQPAASTLLVADGKSPYGTRKSQLSKEEKGIIIDEAH
jgi:hypothetical protein